MKSKFATLQVLFIVILCGCATHYNEPDPTKVIESTKQVKQSITKARDNSKKVTVSIKLAQDTSDHLTILSHGLMTRIDELLGLLPDNFKPPMLLIKADVTSQQTNLIVLEGALNQAYQTQNTQEITLAELTTHETELEKHQLEYRNDAQKLADKTTKLSAKVAWYQWHWWGSWIALGVGVLLCLAFAVLKFLGKLPI